MENKDNFTMNLSIIIVSYNTQELLKKCLLSLKGATQNIITEIFVVDNNSQDQTVNMIKDSFPTVKLIVNKTNRGFSKANNQAIVKAKGRYILILNPDTEVFPDTLHKMIDYMSSNPKVAIASCKVELTNGTIDQDCRRRFPTPWRAFCHFTQLSKIFKGSKIFDQYYLGYIPEDIEQEVDSVVGAFMIVRTQAIKKVGLFDEDFFFYGEDLDWCWRFKNAGYKVIYTPITKIIHHKGAASGIKQSSAHLTKATQESKKRALYESVHAMELFFKKHYLTKYPFVINWSVIASLKILERLRVLSA